MIQSVTLDSKNVSSSIGIRSASSEMPIAFAEVWIDAEIIMANSTVDTVQIYPAIAIR